MPTARPPHLRRSTLVALGLCTALAITACDTASNAGGPITSESTSSTPAPRGVVSKAEAEKILDRYQSINNRANAQQDIKLLGTVEAGQLHELSKAEYRQFPTWTAKEQKEYRTPFRYVNREYYIPAEGVTWFAVKTRTEPGAADSGALLVFDKVGSTYKLVMASHAGDSAIPKIAVNEHGLATALSPSRKIGPMAPKDLAEAYEDFFETGGRTAGTTFASTKTSKQSKAVHDDGVDDDLKGYATEKYLAETPAHPKVYALQLANRGALVLFPTAHTNELLLKERYRSSFDITPDPISSIYNPARRDLVVSRFEGQALAVLHPQAKPAVNHIRYRVVSSR